MSDLLHIEILQVEETKCYARLSSTHPDQTNIPNVENIAFQIVMEAYNELGPFDTHPWKEKMELWKSYMFRQQVPITIEEFDAYDSGKVDLPRGSSGLGWEGDKKFLMMRENNREFVRAANNEIMNIELTDTAEQDGLPVGTLVFESYEPGLFAHMKSGQNWDSAMYDRTYAM